MHRPIGYALSAALLFGAAVIAGPVAAQAQHTMMAPKDLKWGPAPPSLPKGAKVAVLQGDPGKAGPFVLRLSVPGSYMIGPHWHSQDEQLTVISGTFYLGYGDKLDKKQARGLPAGGFHYLPAKEHHFAYSQGPTIVQVAGEGPFDITYLNAADDPQKKM